MDGVHQLYEELAAEMRLLARLKPFENALATTIITRILGPNGVRIDDGLAGPAYLCRLINGAYQVVARPDVPHIRFAMTHELSHYGIREVAGWKLDRLTEERAANYIAAAILAPPEALRQAHAHFGNTLRALRPLANAFGLSQTSMHLRLAEVLGDDRALVTARQGYVMSRGSGWGSVPIIGLARGRIRRPDVERATLRGGIDEGRVALHLR